MTRAGGPDGDGGESEGTTIEEVADRLYAVGPEDFMAQRTARAKEAKAAGEKELAAQIGTLRKPTRSAWVINLLARDAADELQELLDLGAALAEATRTLSGPDLRRLSTQRNAAVDRLTRRAVALAADHDHQVSEAQRTEVSQTLQAALADPNVAHVVRSGVLTKATQYGGFGPLDVIGAVEPGRIPTPTGAEAGTGTDRARTGTRRPAAQEAADEADRKAAHTEAERRLREATTTAAEAAEAAREAEQETETASEQADELIMQVAQLRSRLADAEQEAEAARTALADATARRDRARTTARDADRAVAAAEAARRDLG